MKFRLFGALAAVGLLASAAALAAPLHEVKASLSGIESVKTEAAGTQHTLSNPAVFDANGEQSMQQKAHDSGHIDLATNNPDQSLLAPLPVMNKQVALDNTLAPPLGQQFVAIDHRACTTTIGHEPAFTFGHIMTSASGGSGSITVSGRSQGIITPTQLVRGDDSHLLKKIADGHITSLS